MEMSDRLAAQVGRLQIGNDGILASCFPVSKDVVVTCYHALKNVKYTQTSLMVYWPRLSLVRTAEVIDNQISPEDDIAFLRLNEPLPANLELVRIGFRHCNNGKFMSFGYRKSSYYDGLFATGKLLGEIHAKDGRQLIQLQTNEIDRGMSGAPVFDEAYGAIIGMVSEYWAAISTTDSSLAFAIPISRLLSVRPEVSSEIPELVAAPKTSDAGLLSGSSGEYLLDYGVTNRDLVEACARLSLLVSADQFADGAWGRSLWKETGIKYTTDVAPKEYVSRTHIKKALSATSWAAQALAKATGIVSLPAVKRATSFALQHRDVVTGAFGNIYPINSGTPLISRSTVIRSPRHTASGIKLLELAHGINLDVIKGFEFIIKHQCDNGGWGEAIGDEPNTLSTAYVLDALIKLMQIPMLKKMLSPKMVITAKAAISRGKMWLIEQRDHDGLWRYADSNEFKPLYSAHVIGFVPQLYTDYPEEMIESIDALIALRSGSGIPASLSGDADFTTTALCLYGMLRVDPDRYKNVIGEFVDWLVKCVLSDEWLANYSCLEGIMGLVALTQLPNVPRVELSQRITPIICYKSIDDYGLNDSLPLWLELDGQFGLGVSSVIERMYNVCKIS